MLSAASQLLARTSSTSSVCSDDSLASSDTTPSLGPPDAIVDGPKRTRKRFTTMQLMMLEHLYHKASHPTREQREQLAKDAEISDVRSVTVWFQNKRQTDRRMHRQLSEPTPLPLQVQSCSSPAPSMALPPSSPFSDASGKTIHTVRARTRTLSGNSVASALSTSSMPTTTTRKREHERDPTHRHVRRKPSRHLSLDTIAARSERPVLLPRTPPQCVASSSSPTRPHTPEPPSEDGRSDGGDVCEASRALWQNMQSSPAAPDPAPRSERDIVRYGRRRYTLEYACAKEMVSGTVRETRAGAKGKQKTEGGVRRRHARNGKGYDAVGPLGTEGTQEGTEDDQEVPVLDWDLDMLGDTDTEGVPSEVVTPSSSFGIGELSVQDDHEKENKASQIGSGPTVVPPKEVKDTRTDEDLMDVAYVLCGLSQRC
ncbi:hypothetical protein C8Q79DRAFT_938603 [Trametes meyenii]|nr:hypothetical protein C8Q79DRAFT_938603 [Trametes meyenii]